MRPDREETQWYVFFGFYLIQMVKWACRYYAASNARAVQQPGDVGGCGPGPDLARARQAQSPGRERRQRRDAQRP